jgi:hypothetical protein
MAKSDKKSPKSKKTAKLKDLPPKPKGGDAVKGGLKVTLEDVLVSQVKSPASPIVRPT